ncbi:TPA: hypothetical protein ACX6RY_001986 [Photobacterium damselae]
MKNNLDIAKTTKSACKPANAQQLLNEEILYLANGTSSLINTFNSRMVGELVCDYSVAQDIKIRSGLLISTLKRIHRICDNSINPSSLSDDDCKILEDKLSKITKQELLNLLKNNGY